MSALLQGAPILFLPPLDDPNPVALASLLEDALGRESLARGVQTALGGASGHARFHLMFSNDLEDAQYEFLEYDESDSSVRPLARRIRSHAKSI